MRESGDLAVVHFQTGMLGGDPVRSGKLVIVGASSPTRLVDHHQGLTQIFLRYVCDQPAVKIEAAARRPELSRLRVTRRDQQREARHTAESGNNWDTRLAGRLRRVVRRLL